nr:MAG: capsid protein [Nodaviridae sp.]
MVTFTENSKVPDGALPNSAIIELREALIIRPPNANPSQIDINSGAMWTLTVIHVPMFRTSCVLVASLTNAEMDPSDRAALIQYWNSNEEMPVYPDWVNFINSTWVTTIRWTGLQNVDPPSATGTRAIQQFRITADGMTMFNNTPDLINQGMVIGAQWPLNVSTDVERGDENLTGYSGTVQINLAQGNNSPQGTRTVTIQARIPVDPSTVTVTSAINAEARTATAAAVPWVYVQAVAWDETQDAVLSFTVLASHSFSWGNDQLMVSKGDTLTYVFTYTAPASPNVRNITFSITDTSTTDPLVLVNYTNVVDLNNYYQITILDALELPQVTVWQLPPTDTQDIIQSTPKAVYMSAKEQNGVYMVKRIFQPVFNVQEANARRPVVLTSTDVAQRGFSFAPSDTFDLNYGVGVTVWTSIPLACCPAIKLIRDIEVVAGDGSAYMPFMKSNEDKCEAALEIVRSISVHHPMLYPESYNMLGSLMGILNNVVGKIPILGNVVQAVPSIVKGLIGGEKTVSNGSSQNRLASTNVDELAKLAQTLLSQLNLR